VDFIHNEEGHNTTPCVAFTHNERLTGDGAKIHAATNPDNSV